MELRVLIADSDAVLLDVVTHYLNRHNFAVQTATDGLDFMAKLRQSRPDVAVLDLNILWGGGDGVLALLREEGAFELPVLLTSTTEIEDADPPVFCRFRKPFTLSALTAALAELRRELSTNVEHAASAGCLGGRLAAMSSSEEGHGIR